MKTLLLMRHAQAQPDTGDGDHARILDPTGRLDAQRMGDVVLRLFGLPGALLASDATRARQTAEIVTSALGIPGMFAARSQLYMADAPALLAVVGEFGDEVESVLLVGHNPGLEELTATLAGTRGEEVRLPPGGIAHLALDVPDWAAIQPGSARLLGMLTPATIS